MHTTIERVKGPSVRRWTRDEYHRIAEAGLFHGERVELMDGRIIKMPPQMDEHAVGIMLAETELRRVFGEGYSYRVQMPLRSAESIEPEPDIAIVARRTT